MQVVLKPYHYFWPLLAKGTTHGSPHPYDTHVPLLLYGPGIPQGVFSEPVTPQATAAILARSLGIPPPAMPRPKYRQVSCLSNLPGLLVAEIEVDPASRAGGWPVPLPR